MEGIVICVMMVILLLGGSKAKLQRGRLEVKLKPENQCRFVQQDIGVN